MPKPSARSPKNTGKTPAAPARPREDSQVTLVFENNALLPSLYGEADAHLMRLEKKFGITAHSRGNILVLSGSAHAMEAASMVLHSLYGKLEQGDDIGMAQVDAAIRMMVPREGKKHSREIEGADGIHTLKRTVIPYSHAQADYIDLLQKNDLVFALGPAGTGKTYIAVAQAVSLFIQKKVERIILSRPAVEAGEKLGFLPGDLKEKIDPYLRPLYDALYDMIPSEKVLQYLEHGTIEVAPLAFMRGRTLANSFIILDEAQNTTPTQMKMFLTRLGENSRMVVTGDLSQTDLPKDVASGLRDAVRKVEHIEGIGVVKFGEEDVVRHELAAKIVQAYEEWDRRKKNGTPA